MNQDEINKFLMKFTIIKTILTILMFVLIFVNLPLTIFFSISCHILALVMFQQSYLSWFKSIFSAASKLYESYKDNVYLYWFLEVAYISSCVCLLGIVEVYTFTQSENYKKFKEESKL